MANPNIKIKRTDPFLGKTDCRTVTYWRIRSLNFYDADLFVQRYRPGIGSDVISIGAGAV